MEDDTSRKLVISVIAILVIILATNNFMDFSGEVVKSCIDKDKGVNDIYTSSYASYSDGSGVVYDRCWSPDTLDEAYCIGGIPTRQGANCKYSPGCVNSRNGAYCTQAPVTSAQKRAKR